MSAKMTGGRIADDDANVVISGPEPLADGFRPYQRFRFTQAAHTAPRIADILRAGPSVAIRLALNRGRLSDIVDAGTVLR
jgi:hypothetical protein